MIEPLRRLFLPRPDPRVSDERIDRLRREVAVLANPLVVGAFAALVADVALFMGAVTALLGRALLGVFFPLEFVAAVFMPGLMSGGLFHLWGGVTPGARRQFAGGLPGILVMGLIFKVLTGRPWSQFVPASVGYMIAAALWAWSARRAELREDAAGERSRR